MEKHPRMHSKMVLQFSKVNKIQVEFAAVTMSTMMIVCGKNIERYMEKKRPTSYTLLLVDAVLKRV